jgi:hypothetical protein
LWEAARSRWCHFGSYFQLRLLPSDSHSIAVVIRFWRVASVFASVTHSLSCTLFKIVHEWIGKTVNGILHHETSLSFSEIAVSVVC